MDTLGFRQQNTSQPTHQMWRLHQDLYWDTVTKTAASKHLMEKNEPDKIRRLQQASVDKR